MAERSIKVTGLPEDVSDKKVQIHFTKKKSGGGPVEKVTMLSGENAAIVVFQDAQVPKQVMLQEQTIQGKIVTVAMVEREIKKTPSVPVSEPGHNSKTVVVSGLPDGSSRNAIKIYFQAKKRGGEVEAVTLLGGGDAALVTFKNPEVAKSVASKQHNMGSKTLKVELKEDQAEQGSETENEPKDSLKRNETENDKSKKPLDQPNSQEQGKELWEEEQGSSEAQKTIVVSDIPPNVSGQDLIMYFQKKANGGGELASPPLMFPDERKAIVIFEEVKVANRVLTKKHVIKDKEVKVEKYEPEPEKIKVDFIFSKLTALINYSVLQNVEPPKWKAILDETQLATGVQWHDAAYGFLLSGNLDQITQAKHFLQTKLNLECAEQPGAQVKPQEVIRQPERFMGQPQRFMGQPQRFMGQPERFMGQPPGGFNWHWRGTTLPPPGFIPQQLRFMAPMRTVMWQQRPQSVMRQPQPLMGQPLMGQYQGVRGQPQGHEGIGRPLEMMDEAQISKVQPDGTGERPQEHGTEVMKLQAAFTNKEKPFSEYVQLGYGGQGDAKAPTLMTPSLFTGKSQKDSDPSSLGQGHGRNSCPPGLPNTTDATGEKSKPTPAPRRNKTEDAKSAARKMCAVFPPPATAAASGQDQPDGGFYNNSQPAAVGKNNMMEYGMETEYGNIKLPQDNRDGKAQGDKGNGSPTLEEAAGKVKSLGVQNGADGQGIVDDVLKSFDQMSVNDDPAPISVAEFALHVNQSDIEQFKSRYQVDVVLSKTKKTLQFAPMRGFDQSNADEVAKSLQQLQERASRSFTSEKLDLSELPGGGAENVKISMRRKLERSRDVMVIPTATENVFTLVGDAENVDLFRRNVLNVVRDAPESEIESAPLVANYKGVRVVLTMGDIEKQDIQAIVNFTDNQLGHAKGLPSTIRSAAGEKFWAECRSIIAKNGTLLDNMVAITTACDLPSQCVIHAVLVSPKERRQEFLRSSLESTCRQVLGLAKERSVKSVCFPLMTPDLVNLPSSVSSRLLFGVVKSFVDGNNSLTGGNAIDEIRVVYRKHSKGVEDCRKEFNSHF